MLKSGVTMPDSKQAPGNQTTTPPVEPPVPKEPANDQDNTKTDDQNQNDPLDQTISDLPSDVQSQINDIGDRVNTQVAGVAVDVSVPGAARSKESEEDPFFDTLPLTNKKAAAEDAAAGNSGTQTAPEAPAAENGGTKTTSEAPAAENGGTQTASKAPASGNANTTAAPKKSRAEIDSGLKTRIETLRGGKMYEAVIVARLLKKNKKNPMAASGAADRFSRFLDSSALDVASDLNTIAGNGLGLLTTFDTDSTSKTVFQGMTLVSNLLTIVSTCRNMTIKIRKLSDFTDKHKAGEKISKIDTALTLLGIASDMLTMMVKGVSIIKTIMSMAGKNNRIVNMISNAMFLLTGATQIISALNDIRGLQTGYVGLKKLKGDIQPYRKAAANVIEKNEEKLKKKMKDVPAGKPGSWSESDRIEAAKVLLQDKDLSEDDKDALVSYLGLTKRITKMERSLAVTTTTLINSAIGLLSTGVSGANTVVNGRGEKNKTLKDASTGMGAVSNVSNMLTSSAKIANKAAGAAGGGSKGIVKQSLWSKVNELTLDERGLKGLDESLAKPSAEREKVKGHRVSTLARQTINLYEKAETQFQIMGVPYAKLIRAGSLSKFKDMLVEGL